jgi:hypothetical protein
MEPLHLPILISPKEQGKKSESLFQTKKTFKEIEVNLNNLANHIIKLEEQEPLHSEIESIGLKLKVLESNINFDIGYLRSSIDTNYKILSERTDYIEKKCTNSKTSTMIQLAVCSFITYLIFKHC